MLNKAMNASLALVACFALSACGNNDGNKFLQNVGVAIENHGFDTYVNLSSEVRLGNVSLSELSVPVKNPKTGVHMGDISFSQLPSGNGKITLSVNSSLFVDADPELALVLPNGKPVPAILGWKAGEVSAVDVLKNSRVYIGGDTQEKIHIGFALGIKGLDNVMGDIGSPANLFYSKEFGKVFASGGIYASPDAGGNGIAVFANYTPSSVSIQTIEASGSDYEVNKLNNKTLRKMNKFFYGKPRKLEIH